ncbi:MAG: SnoaL-like domain-containing protein [Gemmatimonadetes bacterium]|nr:SnoaL-like domain-containing protein [Gemmatimonadota bacterium]
MRNARILSPLVVLLFLSFHQLNAQNQRDIDSVHQLLDRYTELEESMDMMGQAQLMSPDRVWIGPGSGRTTDQAKNMDIQAAQFANNQAAMGGLKWFVDDRDRLVNFFGGGRVAVASFFRYMTYIVPADAPQEMADALAATQPVAMTLVLEKSDGEWKIVHTHVSDLIPPPGA